MGGGGGHGAFLRKDANLSDVDDVEASQKNLELFDERSNTFLGEDAGEKLKEGGSTGNLNTALGKSALLNNTDGNSNTAVGSSALVNNTNGRFNTAVGYLTLQENTVGTNNAAVGGGGAPG